MNLALVLGKSSSSIEPKLSKVRDNLNIESFVDIQRFINRTIKMDLTFDRVIILSPLIKSDAYIEDLYKFWKTYISNSEIVLLCRSGVDDDLAKAFLNRFCSVSVTTMSVSSTTLNTIGEAVVLPIRDIINKYGIKDYLAVEVENDMYEEPKTEIEVKDSVSDKGSKGGTGKKKKRTLLGVLFGGKKESKRQKVEKIDIQDESSTAENSYEHTNQISEQEETPLRPESIQSEQDESYNTVNSTYEHEDLNQELNGVDSVTSIENKEENIEYSSLDNENTSIESLEELDDDIDLDDEDKDFNFEQEDDLDSSLNIQSDDAEDSYLNEISDDSLGEDSDSPIIVDEDFDDLIYSGGIDTIQSTDDFDVQESVVEDEVEDIETDLSVGSAEEEYRKKTETPKVIKETVVKEVIRNVKTSSVLDSLYKGLTNKIIIVTGDRGSGVTTLAWSLALHFSEKIPVLYFDCDVENHGLMNYIDYFDFKNYEVTHSQGVKLCRSSQVFNSCVCKWNTNIDLLTSDFGVDVTDDELIDCQGVVAENLSNYGVVIVDCPISKLHCLQDLILTGNVALCIEDSKRGYMNALMNIDKSDLPLRYRRNIISRGTIIRTKINPKQDYKRLIKYIEDIVDFEDCNWLGMSKKEFNGKVTKELLLEILEV